MKLMMPKQMQILDKKATLKYHIPSILLMEQAAFQVFKKIEALKIGTNIVIVCGPGNNGGDGLALARQLTIWASCKVKVILLGKPEKLTEDGRTYYNIVKSMQIDLIHLQEELTKEVFHLLNEANLIVDAIFGTGLTRDIVGLYANVISEMNKSSAYKISIDIPSGVHGKDGKILGEAVKADETITFVLPKLGLYRYPAIDYVGKISVVDIGIPISLIEEAETSYYTIDKENMKTLLPKRYTRSNKGTYGKVLTIGGKTGMSGAITLTSTAALLVGAGIVTAAVPRVVHDIMEQKLTEVMTVPLEDEDGHISMHATKQLEQLIGSHDVIAIGPGIGRSTAIPKLLLTVLASDKPCIIDADGLFFLSEMLEIIQNRKAPTIITPHPGEMARLTGLTIEQILDDPLETTQTFSMKNNVITVLKIERTVIGSVAGTIYINRYGNNGMAKGGSGDVLTGVIVGLLAQHMSAIDAAILGVYLHSRAGDIMRSLKTQYTLLPTDLYEGLNRAFKELLE